MFTHHKIGQKQKQRKNTLLFITGLFLFLFGLLTTMNCNVRADNATTLNPGDLFVVTVNGIPDFICGLYFKTTRGGKNQIGIL